MGVHLFLPRKVQKRGKIRFLLVFTVNSVINGNEADTLLRGKIFTDLDKTTKNLCEAADNKFKYAMEQKAISLIVADCFFVV